MTLEELNSLNTHFKAWVESKNYGTGTVSPDEMNTAIADYIVANNLEHLTTSQVAQQISDYWIANPDVDRTDLQVNALIAQYLIDNPQNSLTYNINSINNTGMVESDVQDTIDAKINTAISSLPINTNTVYEYTPKPFFAGLTQPPQESEFPSGTGNNTINANTKSIVAVSEDKVFLAIQTGNIIEAVSNGITIAEGNSNNIFEYDLDTNGNITNGKIIYSSLKSGDYVAKRPSSLEVSIDNKTLVMGQRDGFVITLAKSTDGSYTLAHEMQLSVGYRAKVSLSGNAEWLMVRVISNDSYSVYRIYLYKANFGSWALHQTLEAGIAQTEQGEIEAIALSKDGKRVMWTHLLYSFKDAKRVDINDMFDVTASTISRYKEPSLVFNNLATTMALSGDGSKLYVASPNLVSIYKPKDYGANPDNYFEWELESSFSGSGGRFADSLAISHSTKYLVVASEVAGKFKVYTKEEAKPPTVAPNQTLSIIEGDYREVINLVNNGNFDTDLTGWISQIYTMTYTGSALQFKNTLYANSKVYSMVEVLEAGIYDFSFDLISSDGSFVYGLSIGSQSGAVVNSAINVDLIPRTITLSGLNLAIGTYAIWYSQATVATTELERVTAVIDNVTLIKT